MSDYLTEGWPLGSTSTVYMNGNSVYHVRHHGKPGIVATVELSQDQAEAIREVVRNASGKLRPTHGTKDTERMCNARWTTAAVAPTTRVNADAESTGPEKSSHPTRTGPSRDGG